MTTAIAWKTEKMMVASAPKEKAAPGLRTTNKRNHSPTTGYGVWGSREFTTAHLLS